MALHPLAAQIVLAAHNRGLTPAQYVRYLQSHPAARNPRIDYFPGRERFPAPGDYYGGVRGYPQLPPRRVLPGGPGPPVPVHAYPRLPPRRVFPGPPVVRAPFPGSIHPLPFAPETMGYAPGHLRPRVEPYPYPSPFVY
jgi:hypothetical protein